jgi:HPt (histidine-containing phosphotransfer) domain-containing protein
MPGKSRLYNLEKLYEIDNTNKEFIREIISVFLNSIPLNARDLVTAANEKKWDKVYFLAHKMKANIDLLNIKTIREDIRIIERNAKAKIHQEQIIDRAKFINITIQQCAKELQEDFAINFHFDPERNCH